ncbi:acyl-CoA dehydrogenase family protein [Sorangium sp. So ce426]|uniref:acyl-CoA dehydrogenase family protein n=1 Tax=unclassified Sorangium TaxID=2621164 RepID=UPI003F5B119B
MKNEDAAKVLHAVRDLTPAIASRSAEIEEARRLPADLLGQLKAAGCFRMFVPRSHGGHEVDLRTGMDVLEALARADGATGWTVMIGSESPNLFALLPRERFDAIYAGGPDVIIGGGFNAQGEAHATDGGYRVTGRWSFASGCEHASWLFGNCVIMDGGRPRMGPAGEAGEVRETPEMRGMLFPAGEARIIDTWSVLGLRGTGSHDIALEGAFCPEVNTFDIFGGQPSVAGPGFVAPVLHFVLHMGAVAVGIAQGALDDVVTLASSGKKRLYARAQLADSPLFQVNLGRAETSVRAARALLRDMGDELWDACVNNPGAALAMAPRISGALAWVTEVTARAVDACYQAGGGGVARNASPVQRRFRDIHTFSQHAAAAEGWFGQAGAALLGQPTGFWT